MQLKLTLLTTNFQIKKILTNLLVSIFFILKFYCDKIVFFYIIESLKNILNQKN